jgi:hypothetical protein
MEYLIDLAFDASTTRPTSSRKPLPSEHKQSTYSASEDRNTYYNYKSMMNKMSSWMELAKDEEDKS